MADGRAEPCAQSNEARSLRRHWAFGFGQPYDDAVAAEWRAALAGIDPDSCTATPDWHGQHLHFCSESCRDRFVDDPDRSVVLDGRRPN